jgi:hypothetical protein
VGDGFAAVDSQRRFLVQDAGALKLGRPLREAVLPVLHRTEGLAEQCPGSHSLNCQAECGLRDAYPRGGDTNSAVGQRTEGNREAISDLSEHVRRRNLDVVEHDIGSELTAMTHLEVRKLRPELPHCS